MDVKPIYIVGLIDLNYIECYHNTITISVKVLFDFYIRLLFIEDKFLSIKRRFKMRGSMKFKKIAALLELSPLLAACLSLVVAIQLRVKDMARRY